MTIKEIEVKMQLGISEEDAIAAASYILEDKGNNVDVLAALISKISSDKNRTFKNMHSIYSDLMNFTSEDIREYLAKDNAFYVNHKDSIDSISEHEMKIALANSAVAVNKLLA